MRTMTHNITPLRVCEDLPEERRDIYELKKWERPIFNTSKGVDRSVPSILVHRRWEQPLSLEINARLMRSAVGRAIAKDVKQLLYDTELMFLINRLEGPPEEYKILRGLGIKDELVRIALERRRAYAVYNNSKSLMRTISVSSPSALSLTPKLPSKRIQELLTCRP